MQLLVSLKKDDIEEIRKLYEQSFEDSKQFVDYYFDEKIVAERVMAIKENNSIIAMLHLNPFRVQMNNKSYDVSYIVAVATHIKFRNRGYMGQLMEAALNRLYNQGEVFSLLMPIDSRIYERYGFGFIEDHIKMDINTKTISTENIPYTCWSFTEKDLSLLCRQFEKFSKNYNLITMRDEKDFLKLYKELRTDNGSIIVFKEGYLMMYYEGNILHIREIVYNTVDAFYEITSFIQEKSRMGRVVIFDHEYSKLKYYIPNIKDNTITVKPFMMARIINVEEFINKNIDLFVENIRIKVTDSYIGMNNAVYQITENKAAKYIVSDYDFEIDIKTLTQLCFGYLDSEQSEFKEVFNRSFPARNFFNEYV